MRLWGSTWLGERGRLPQFERFPAVHSREEHPYQNLFRQPQRAASSRCALGCWGCHLRSTSGEEGSHSDESWSGGKVSRGSIEVYH